MTTDTVQILLDEQLKDDSWDLQDICLPVHMSILHDEAALFF